MAFYTNQISYQSAKGLAQEVTSLREKFSARLARFVRTYQIRQTYLALDALSDKELDDIGLVRSGLRRHARDAVDNLL